MIATRLSLFALTEGAELSVSDLLAAVDEVWPKGGGVACLNLNSEHLLRSLLASRPPVNVIVEIPSEIDRPARPLRPALADQWFQLHHSR